MPKRGTIDEAIRFLNRHSGWLKSQIDRLPPTTALADGAPIPFRGVMHVIRHMSGGRGTVSVLPDSDPPVLEVFGDARHLRRRVLDFMKREAKRDIEWAVIRHSLAIGARAKAIGLRDQTSRWGSCSPDGRLSFSWRLVMALPFVRLSRRPRRAHLREHNHSQRFWRPESMCPETAAARRWLAHNGPALHAIGADG